MNKLKVVIYNLLCLSLFTAASCSQIFEEDISDASLNVLSPSANMQTPYYNQTFWWEKIDGATQYRIQIVAPSFNNLQLLVLDTTCSGDKFAYTLKPGTYQWRMRAENYNYQTDYVLGNLIIDTADLDLQYPTLLTPNNNVVSNSATFNFTWVEVYGATKYYIEIDTITNNFITPTKKDSTANNYYSYTFARDGKYKWRVRGTDGTVKTIWSDVRNLELDRIKPTSVTLNSPAASANQPNPVTFSWAGISDAVYYKLYVYKVDGVTPYSSTFPLRVDGISTVVSTIASRSTVFWTVTAVDAAGNESIAPPTRQLIIQ